MLLKRVIFVVMGGLILLSAGCGKKKERPNISDEAILTMRMHSNPTTLNPVSAVGAYADTIQRLVFDTLVEYDFDLKPIPCMAKSWAWTEKTVDGKKKYILTFKLRDDIYWHDGVKFTAHDMVFTYEKIMDPLSKAQNKIPKFEGVVDKVEATDNYTFVVTYNKPLATAIGSWEIYPLPKHLYENEDLHKSPYNRKPIGTGPYRLIKWETAKYLKLEMNTNYWRKPPHIKNFTYKIISDDNVALSAFKKGMFDLYGLEPEEYLEEKDKVYFQSNYNVQTYYSFGFSQIAWDCTSNSIFSDKKVRQAMTYALDRKQIIKEVLHGFADVSSGPFFYGSWAYDHNVKPLVYNLERAKQLLVENGWKDTDGDGVLDKDGKPFKFELVHGQVPIWTQMSVNLQQNLRKIGVDMSIRVLEWSAFSKRLHEHNFDAAIFAWSLDFDPDPFDIFHSSQISNGINYGGYANPEADKMMEEARSIFDINERQKIYHKLHRVFNDDQPYTLLFASKVILAKKNELKGVRVSSAGIGQWYPGFFDWYKEKPTGKKAVEK